MMPFFWLAMVLALIAAFLVEAIPDSAKGFLKSLVVGLPAGIAIWLVVIGFAWRICR